MEIEVIHAKQDFGDIILFLCAQLYIDLDTSRSTACTKTMILSSRRLVFAKENKTSKYEVNGLFYARASEEKVEILVFGHVCKEQMNARFNLWLGVGSSMAHSNLHNKFLKNIDEEKYIESYRMNGENKRMEHKSW